MDEILDELVAKGVRGATIVRIAKALEALERQELLRHEHNERQGIYRKNKVSQESRARR